MWTHSGVLLSHEKCCLATACMDLEGTVLSEISQRKTELHNLTYVWNLKSQVHGSREENGGCQGLRGWRETERHQAGGRSLQLEDEWVLGPDVPCRPVVNSTELRAWKLLGAWVLSVSTPLPKGETQSDSVRWCTCPLTWLWWPFPCVYAYQIIMLDTSVCSILLVSKAGKNLKV